MEPSQEEPLWCDSFNHLAQETQVDQPHSFLSLSCNNEDKKEKTTYISLSSWRKGRMKTAVIIIIVVLTEHENWKHREKNILHDIDFLFSFDGSTLADPLAVTHLGSDQSRICLASAWRPHAHVDPSWDKECALLIWSSSVLRLFKFQENKLTENIWYWIAGA